jgi:hypothetical protein
MTRPVQTTSLAAAPCLLLGGSLLHADTAPGATPPPNPMQTRLAETPRSAPQATSVPSGLPSVQPNPQRLDSDAFRKMFQFKKPAPLPPKKIRVPLKLAVAGIGFTLVIPLLLIAGLIRLIRGQPLIQSTTADPREL